VTYPYSIPVDIGDIGDAYLAGCRDARAYPQAAEDDFQRGRDGYVKLVIERKKDVESSMHL